MRERLRLQTPGGLLSGLKRPAVALPLVFGLLILVIVPLFEVVKHRQVSLELKQTSLTYVAQMDAVFRRLLDESSRAVSAVAQPGDESFRQALPKASRVLYVELGALGIAEVNNPVLDSLRHIERDLIRRALDQNQAVLDAFRLDGKWVLAQALPRSQTQVVFAVYPITMLLQPLANFMGAEPVRLELQMRGANDWNTVLQRGDIEPGQVWVRSPLEYRPWALRVTLDQGSYQYQIAQARSLYFLAVLAAVCMLMQWLLGLRTMPRQAEALAKAQPLQEAVSPPVIGKPSLAAPVLKTVEEDFLEVSPSASEGASANRAVPELDATIFRSYDIRGFADSQLGSDLCVAIGRALGSELVDAGQRQILLARDGRNSSPRIRDALVQGLRGAGIDVVDIGAVPTPLLHFATHELGVPSGVMITGSHNGKDYNGLKMVVSGRSLTAEAISRLKQRIVEADYAEGEGGYENAKVVDQYIQRVKDDIIMGRRLKVVVDAANGVTGPIAPRLLQQLGCNVIPLFCELDGDFPNHGPDPTIEDNLDALKKEVLSSKADLGIAFDGDGDRVVFVTERGDFVPPDKVMMILAEDILSRNPASSVVYDVKCSRHLRSVIGENGGIPVMCRSGHSYVKNEVQATQAALGGEFSGHIFIRERWYGFDDGLYVAARLIELLSLSSGNLGDCLQKLPVSSATPEILVACSENQKFALIEKLQSGDYFEAAELNSLDGIRAEYPHGWGLVRASNTGPALTLRFEADSDEALNQIQTVFREALLDVEPTLSLGF